MKKQIYLLFLLSVVIVLFISCKDNPVNPESDRSPAASFTVTPNSADIATVFNFDASACSDKQDAVSVLKVRWDWENDGTWDTDYSVIKTATHRFATEGTITIKLQVMDSGGLTKTCTRKITVTASSGATGTCTDIDGNIYQTIKIGTQWWTAENLKVKRYRNGDAINNSEWIDLTTSAYCNYNDDANNVAIYGRLYNWYAITDSRKIAPAGWHVPSDAEWKKLEMFLGMSQSGADSIYWRGTDEGGKLKESGTTHWKEPNKGATNESGFCALPGGYCDILQSFYNMGRDAAFWSITEYASNNIWYRSVNAASAKIYRNYDANKQHGLSVRLVKD